MVGMQINEREEGSTSPYSRVLRLAETNCILRPVPMLCRVGLSLSYT